MVKLPSTFVFLLIFLNAFSQYFSTGEDPARLKWRQISTVNFQLIYPESFETQAQKLANYFELVYRYGGESLNYKPRKISVIFHTHTVKSNGLVGWAPRRMEIFTPPHQATYGQDWLEQLAIHEFRHVVQVDKVHSQIPGIVKFILGEQSSALITGSYLPFWFLEGDAVVTETALGHFGRGRLPSFLMEHKAQVVEKGIFSYDKAFNRSYRDFVPDHYKLGYHLVGESRYHFGSELWSNAIDRAAQKPWSLTPFNRSLKQHTGLNQVQLYQTIFDSLRVVWKSADFEFNASNFEMIRNSGLSPFTNYIYNHVLPSGSIVTLRTGFDYIPQFICIYPDNSEEIIYTPGQIFEESVSFRDEWIIWSEHVPDLRWTHAGKSIIRLLNSENGQLKSFYPDYKAFSPAISPDKQYVAVLEVDFINNYYLSVYNLSSGTIKERFQSEDNNYFFSPVWINDSTLATIVLTRNGKELCLINPSLKKMELLSVPELWEIKQLFYYNGELYFINGYSGKDELWKISLSDLSTSRILEARFGQAYPAFENDGSLILSDYTANGYQLIRYLPESLKVNVKEEPKKESFQLAEFLSGQEQGSVDFNQSDTIRYNSTRYYKGLNLFKFHSWAPLVFDINSYDVQPGFSLNSQNLLGTAESTLGYKWNMSEKTGKYFVNFEYKGWFPIIKFEAEAGNRSSQYYEIQIFKNQYGEIIRQDTILKDFTWQERNVNLNIRLPLNLTMGPWFRYLQPELKYDVTQFTHNTSTPTGFTNGNMKTLSYRLYYHQILRKAYRDIMPNWGFAGDVSYRNTLNGDVDVGSLVAGQLHTFLPAISRNHGITLYAGYQQRVKGQKHSFGDVIRIPRGWSRMNSNILASFSAEYRMPLFYPDKNFGRWIYFRRVYSAIFGDHAWVSGDILRNGQIEGRFKKEITSIGIDLSADINLMRLYAPATIGIRTAYLPERNDYVFKLLFSIDFTSF